jgi:SAM-dependent methyltransferase
MEKEWFADWFDSPFYHILYKNRDEQEAHLLVDALLRALNLPAGARVLDLACGKGRHAIYLAQKGLDVTGVDISNASISYARQFEHTYLHFYQHDMRLPFRIHYYDAIVNMFTSFGYFETDADHVRTLVNIAKGLNAGGVCLIDFFNALWVRRHLIPEDEKHIDGVHFTMKRHIEGGHVYKSIEVRTPTEHKVYGEKVRLFTLEDFEGMFRKAGLNLLRTYGDYSLAPFDPDQSRRLILVAQKIGTD